MINDLQKHLKTTLQEKMGTKARCEVFPDIPTGYKPKHAKCDVLIHYPGSTYKEVTAGFGLMERSPVIEFRVVTRGYSGESGAIAMLEEVIAAMWNYQPVVANLEMSVLKPLPNGDGFHSFADGIWQYYVRFKTDVLFTGQVSNENK